MLDDSVHIYVSHWSDYPQNRSWVSFYNDEISPFCLWDHLMILKFLTGYYQRWQRESSSLLKDEDFMCRRVESAQLPRDQAGLPRPAEVHQVGDWFLHLQQIVHIVRIVEVYSIERDNHWVGLIWGTVRAKTENSERGMLRILII